MSSECAQPRRRPSPDRILGPYQEGTRWRVVQIVGGTRTARTATTRAKALQIAQQLRQRPATQPPRTLAAALREYDAHLRLVRRLSPASCEQARRTLGAFFVDDEAPISSLTAATARKLARFEPAQTHRIRRRYALSTRYAVLGHAARFFDWAKAHRYVARNPFDGVRPIGLLASGPAPLSLDQARTLAAVALQQAHQDPGALGSLLTLVLGLRSAEVLPLRIQDIDPDAQWLCVVNNQNRPRTVLIPELLRPCVRGALAGKLPGDLLLGAGRTGSTRPHHFLWRALQRLCRQARVSPTCPRSLRTLHRKLAQTALRATTRISEAATTHAASPPTPSASAPGSSAEWVRVVDLLGLSPSMTAPRIDALLSILTASQLAQLHPLLQS
jgi:integrase